MTNGQLLSELRRRLNFDDASPVTAVTTRLQSFINLAHRQILGTPGMELLRDGTLPFTSVTGQGVYGLPPGIERIRRVYDPTNDRVIARRDLGWLRATDPGLDMSGTPDYYIPLGLVAVAKQPADASEIFIKSTAAGDTNTAYIEGFRTGGYPVSLSVNMTGVTAASLGAAYTDIIEITKCYVSAAAVGTITLHEDSGVGTELARIPIGQSFTRYQGIRLWPTPSSAVTYAADCTRNIPDMSAAGDEPLLPADFHWLLVEGALRLEWGQKKDDQDRFRMADESYKKGLSNLKFFVTCPPDDLPVMGKYQRSRRLLMGDLNGSVWGFDAGAFD